LVNLTIWWSDEASLNDLSPNEYSGMMNSFIAFHPLLLESPGCCPPFVKHVPNSWCRILSPCLGDEADYDVGLS
jgi:hypothetical protein